MSTSEERLDALRRLDALQLAASGITNMQTGQRRPTESIISDAEAYLNFISPPLPEKPASMSNQTYDVIYKDGWNAAVDAILAEGAKYRDDDALSVFSIRTQVNSLRK